LQLSNKLEALQSATATSDANCGELTKEVEKYRKQLHDVMEAHDKVIFFYDDLD
uniref:TMF_TATA_bd domain-containing protein n=1 Tax=Brugia pahangi TaxID=6280 RepID=A0A0N4TCC8_BRUPA